ncbi:MAG: outer membrane beta-barrel protein, partial [Pseudomonadota bacterium]
MRKFVIGMAMASTALTAPAMAREGQWYIQGEGGAMLVEDVDFEIDGIEGEASADYEAGYDFGATVGYDFGAFRLETEAAYKSASLDTLTTGSAGLQSGAQPNSPFTDETRGANGDFTALSFMLNGLFDLGPDDGLQAFAGAGIGVARVELDGSTNPNGLGAFDGSDTGLAWQLLAGIRAPISDSWDVGLKYRYFNAEDVTLI